MNSPRKLIEELRFYRSKADTMYSEVEDEFYTIEEYHKALEKLELRTLKAISDDLCEALEKEKPSNADLRENPQRYITITETLDTAQKIIRERMEE